MEIAPVIMAPKECSKRLIKKSGVRSCVSVRGYMRSLSRNNTLNTSHCSSAELLISRKFALSQRPALTPCCC